MTFRMAVLSDLHLPDVDGSAQAAVLDWLLKSIKDDACDLVVVAGDMTAAGAIEGAKLIRKKIQSLGLDFRLIPGNADVRTVACRQEACAQLTQSALFNHEQCVLVFLDCPEGKYTLDDQARLQAAIDQAANKQVVVIAHYPPAAVDCPWLMSLLDAGGIDLYLCGHRHVDHSEVLGKTKIQICRGLDPDKAQDALPCYRVFEFDGQWTSETREFPGSDVCRWSDQEKQGFLSRLGFSCMADSIKGLGMATREGVRCVELRAEPALAESRQDLKKAVLEWRKQGGTTLSIHLPNIGWDEQACEVSGQATWQAAVDLALSLGAEALTIHPPRVSVEQMDEQGKVWQAIQGYMVKTLSPCAAANMTHGIENLHMNPNDKPGVTRQFGCLPEESVAWMQSLKNAMGTATFGVHFDNGHAVNNPPFNNVETLGAWYAKVGPVISGYHIHQIVVDQGRKKNHLPINNVFGPLISYASFFWAWHTKSINHAPIYIEVRGGCENVLISLNTLRSHIG